MHKKWLYLLFVIWSAVSLVACASATPVASGDPSSNTSSVVDTSSTTKVNLNTASADDFLAAIPGLGNRMIREFEEYRPYISIQQFRQEIGKYVDESQVTEYEKYVYVPIAFNESDAETLQQIPGLDASEAAALIAGRPYATVEDFLTALSQYIRFPHRAEPVHYRRGPANCQHVSGSII
jgi:DNA uptake protein ComE-like DNA-binding protein